MGGENSDGPMDVVSPDEALETTPVAIRFVPFVGINLVVIGFLAAPYLTIAP